MNEMKTNFVSNYLRAKVKVFLSFCQWPYGDICSISPVGKGQGTEFNLTFRKGSGKKSETLKFSTEHRTELLTEALVRRPMPQARSLSTSRSEVATLIPEFFPVPTLLSEPVCAHSAV